LVKNAIFKRMKASFLLNNHSVAYLIHGQPLSLKYETEGCWFVVISYKSEESFFKRFFFRKPNGVFETVTNVYRPGITMWGIGWGIRKIIHKRLKINFFNPKTQLVRPHTPQLPSIPSVRVRSAEARFSVPFVNLESQQPVFINNQLTIHSYDDHLAYKRIKVMATKNK
jgi:hypothetical protein